MTRRSNPDMESWLQAYLEGWEREKVRAMFYPFPHRGPKGGMSFFVSFVVVFIGFCKTRQPVYYLAYPTLNRLSPLFSYFYYCFCGRSATVCSRAWLLQFIDSNKKPQKNV